MPGLVPGIRDFAARARRRGWPVKPGHDEQWLSLRFARKEKQ
jgi:hypothetical protein